MWTIQWDDRAVKELRNIDKQSQLEILQYLEKRIMTDDDPRRFGKPLIGNKKGFWRYRVGNYRIICSIEDNIFNVLVVAVGHRKAIYD
ncbi:MAG: type II toxin-antitoxin system RelE/ParE family toxin [Flavobacteriales bacterium]|nr:type II toxin-antitoxin system RelE/ParE family toxin [Flavobacteriales bacterium]